MRPTRPRRFAGVIVTVALSLVAATCATKVISLPVDGGAGGAVGTDARYPAPFCIPFTDPTGADCISCYDNAGAEIKRTCAPSTMGQMCGVIDDPMLGHCVMCMDSTGMTAIRACLRCDPPQGNCTFCNWSDQPDDQCKICSSGDAGAVSDSCSQLRPELQ